jgi:hypothetical protein
MGKKFLVALSLQGFSPISLAARQCDQSRGQVASEAQLCTNKVANFLSFRFIFSGSERNSLSQQRYHEARGVPLSGGRARRTRTRRLCATLQSLVTHFFGNEFSERPSPLQRRPRRLRSKPPAGRSRRFRQCITQC